MFDGLKDAMNSGLSRFTIDGVTWRRDHQPIDGHIEALEDKVDGLDSELASALDVLYRRGDDEAREWIKLNYPKWTPGSLSVETQS